MRFFRYKSRNIDDKIFVLCYRSKHGKNAYKINHAELKCR